MKSLLSPNIIDFLSKPAYSNFNIANKSPEVKW